MAGADPTPAALALRLADVSVSVVADDAMLLEWLAEMVAPGFETGSDVGPSPVLDVSVLEELGHISTPACSEELSVFAVDGRVTRSPGWSDGQVVTVEIAHFEVLVSLGPFGIRIEPASSEAELRGAAFQVVREAAVARALAGDRIQLHAAAVEIDGRVVVFTGPKGAGKTTLAVGLALGGTTLVTNDRLLLDPGSGTWIARGIPTIVRVRGGTLELVPDLVRRLPSLQRLWLSTVAEAVATASTRRPDELHEAWLSMAQLARFAACELSAGGALGCIAVLNPDRPTAGFELGPLDPVIAARELALNCFGARDDRPMTVFEQHAGAGTGTPIQRDRCDELVASVPVVRASVGPELLSDRSAQAEFRSELRRLWP